MWKKKFVLSEHKLLIKSSFTDYSQEKQVWFIKSYVNRITSAIRSRWIYKTAESTIRKKFPKVARSQDNARSDGGLIGQYQWVRLCEIVKIVDLFVIKSVCEFGSGGSTAMFSQLKLDKFVSLEENEKWADRTRQCLPRGAKVDLLRKDRLVLDYDGEPSTRYALPDDFYKQNFDLVYIDGPTARPLTEKESMLNIVDKSKQMMPNVDIELFFSNGFFPRLILVDGRRSTVRRLCEKFGHEYDVYMRYYYKDKHDRTGHFLYHTVFIKK